MIRGQKRRFETNKFENFVFVDGEWLRLSAPRFTYRRCVADLRRWAQARDLRFDLKAMQVKPKQPKGPTPS